MKNFDLPIHENKLETKSDLQQALRQITDPLKQHFSAGCARLHLGNTSAGYTDSIAGMEGFSRVLWGLAPMAAGGADSELWDIYLKGIINGTNPLHPEYWGEIKDYDQRIVEMAAMGFSLTLAPDKIWNPLTRQEKKKFEQWLLQINDHESYDCNWLFFKVIVNIGLYKVGASHDMQVVEKALDRIEAFYIGNGWYADGINGHSDYYVPFAIHFYSLIYAKLMECEDPVRSSLYKERAAIFAKDFIHWFSSDGSALPYGRSLTYRFAQCAFWGALAYAQVEVFSPGVIKGIVLRNLRWWFKQPIFDAGGILTIGYAYPNLVMAENYNSPGSPYWALKAFLPLCLDKSHPFWASREEPLPELEKCKMQIEPHLVICRNQDSGNIMAFNTGHRSSNEHTHVAAKYEKFVYANSFGFSVPRAEWGIGQGAFDSMLALSEGDNLYRAKRYCTVYEMHEDHLYMQWKPWLDVVVKTVIVFGNPWHCRIHVIETARTLDISEGGFALGIEEKSDHEEGYKQVDYNDGSLITSAWGSSAIFELHGDRKPQMVFPNANTNVICSRTAIPSLTTRLAPGKHFLAAAVYADCNGYKHDTAIQNKPVLEKDAGEWSILSPDGKITLFCTNIENIG